MPDFLMVPIRMDALYAGREQPVLEPMADFSRLPYTDPDTDPGDPVRPRDINAGTAYISENIVVEPFNDRSNKLEPGLHLHWALPDALTNGSQPRAQATAEIKGDAVTGITLTDGSDGYQVPPRVTVQGGGGSGAKAEAKIANGRVTEITVTGGGSGYTSAPNVIIDLPPLVFHTIPDRWLVIRSGGDKPEKRWVVESDYLWDEGASWQPGLVAYPLDEKRQGPHRQPYRYLGRAFPLDDPEHPWQEDRQAKEHLGNLTALGYGEPNFHAFYPNCQSVLGLHDPDFAGETPPDGLQYELYGWYSQPENDPLNKLKSKHADDEAGQNAFVKAAEDAFQWTWDADHAPEQTLCYARLTISQGAADKGAYNPDAPDELGANISLAVGNTGTEALAAYLAKEIAGGDDAGKQKIENQLEALNLTHILGEERLDLGMRFKEARHTRTFQPVAGGIIWTLRPPAPDQPRPADARNAEDGVALSLPAELAALLDELNMLQAAYDRGQAQIIDLRRQVYADWYKYMVCCYRPSDARRDYPPVDQARWHLERMVALLNLLEHYVGTPGEPDTLDLAAKNKLRQDTPAQMMMLFDAGFQAWISDETLASPSLATQLAQKLGQIKSMLEQRSALKAAAAQALPNIPTKTPEELKELAISLAARAGGLNDEPAFMPIALQVEQLMQALPPDEQEDLPASDLSGMFKYLQRLADKDPEAAKTALEAAAGRLASLPDVVLMPSAAPRYWQPTEPVVLLVGPGVEPTVRHGVDGTLNCDVKSCNAASGSADFLKWLEQMESLDNRLYVETCAQPWHPLLLEWDVSIAPVRGLSGDGEPRGEGNIQPATRRYAADFVTANYELEETRSDFIHSQRCSVTAASTTILSGRSILTPHARALLAQRIDDYLQERVKNYLRDKEIEPQPDDLLRYFDSNEQDIIAWCDQLHQATLVDGYFVAPVIAETAPPDSEKARQEAMQEQAPPSPLDAKVEFFKQYRKDILGWYQECTPGGAQADSPVHTVAQARKTLQGLAGIQSQSLGGFNAALLMHKQTSQLPVADPINFDEYRAFTEQTVRPAVADQNRLAPMPHFDFHPLRTGRMQLNRLRLVDTFGRAVHLDPNHLITTGPLTTDPPGKVALPARITQPARLNFRWLAAEVERLETNAHPLTTPVCGWLLPNNLDRSLMVYDNQGSPLGYLDETGHWRMPPGRPGPVMPEDILNPFLARMVAWLRDQARKAGDAETGFMGDFLDVLDNALEQIAPANFAQHEARALLMGRPIALVRAAVDLQVRGLPAMNQSWEAYRAVLDNLPPTTDGFRDVRFPIRIGEHLRLQDGTIGYWIETGDGKFEQDRFYAPQSRQLSATDTEKNLLIYAGPDQDFNFYQAINAAPTIVSILMDPLGAVHCTTGVLPTKALRLPKEHYAGALKAINITFLSAPVLTERGQVHLPLPAEPGWGWSWVQRDGSRWTELSTTPVVEQEALLKAFPLHGEMIWNLLLQNGWLQRRNGSVQRATPQIKDRAGFTQKLDALLHSNGVSHGSFDATDVLHVLDVSARFLGPVHTDARFGPATEIREGWLKLSREDDAYISPSAKTSQG